MDSRDRYENPLVTRYASREMAELWSPLRRYRLWRRLWIALAEAERELGLEISAEQIAELKAHADDVQFEAAERYEESLRHDVMAHVHAWGDQCPAARPIIHLGATSCYVTDNADLILMREALLLVRRRLLGVVRHLAAIARRTRFIPCLAYTHFQPAQPTTVGKRICLWIHDLVMDAAELQARIAGLRLRGVKGATGTQASFLALFHGDFQRVEELEERVVQKLGFSSSYDVTGQTYPRKVDAQVLATLAGVAQSAHKAATDLRLLQGFREMEEPFEERQIGSSAMAYKRNPMRSERICALARFVMGLTSGAETTAAVQWLERTLDDSAYRRLTIPEAFLAVDALLLLYRNVAAGLVVHEDVIGTRLRAELPFLVTENVLMAAVEQGGDRQDLHERIRRHSHAAADRVKQGGANDLLDRLARDPALAGVDLKQLADPATLVGCAPRQVERFLERVVEPLLSDLVDEGDSPVRV